MLSNSEWQWQYSQLQRRGAVKPGVVCFYAMLATAIPAVAAEIDGQSTSGWCSPIQSGNGNIFNCYGVDPRAMKRLNDELDQMESI
jgi:hypothetical protein